MIGRQVIVVDTETSGLDPARHTTLEVAWWNLTTDERGLFIPPHNVSTVLAGADIEALRVNRYIDRIPGQPQDLDDTELHRLWSQFTDYDEDDVTDDGRAAETRHVLAGANPAFDAAFLSNLFAGLARVAPWHHRLLDLSAYAAGVLGLDVDELPGLRTVCALLNVEPGDHTAEGDVTATGLCFRALFAKAAQR